MTPDQVYPTLYYEIKIHLYNNTYSSAHYASLDATTNYIRSLNKKDYLSLKIIQYQKAYDSYFGLLLVNDKDITKEILENYIFQ